MEHAASSNDLLGIALYTHLSFLRHDEHLIEDPAARRQHSLDAVSSILLPKHNQTCSKGYHTAPSSNLGPAVCPESINDLKDSRHPLHRILVYLTSQLLLYLVRMPPHTLVLELRHKRLFTNLLRVQPVD